MYSLPLKEDLRTINLVDKDLAESLCGDGCGWTPVPENIDVARKLKTGNQLDKLKLF